jgi:hypothetical protein
MATVEGLFNFDEKLLARDVAGQRQDYMFANSMPKGYGAVGMGWNQMLRGLFNNNDPILKEKALAEEALQMTQQQLGGDMTDPAKMYGQLMKNLTELGASPESISMVADKKAVIESDGANQEIANQLKLLTIQQTQGKNDQGDITKFREYRQKVAKQLNTELSLDSLSANKQNLFALSDKLTDNDENARDSFNNLILSEITNVINGKKVEDDFDSNSVLKEAAKNVAEKYKWKEGSWNNGVITGEKGMWVEDKMTNGDTVNKDDKANLTPELKDLLERNKTK